MPKATGFDAVVWVLPAVAFISAVAGLIVAFRRWHVDAALTAAPTADDRALVDAALREDDAPDE